VTGDLADLESQARAFALRLSETVVAVVGPQVAPFRVTAAGVGGRQRFTVEQDPAQGIVLHRGGQPIVTLKVTYQCEWDTAQQFLAVDISKCAVYAGAAASGEPWQRLDYVRQTRSTGVPVSHWNSHGRHERIEQVLDAVGRTGRKAATLHLPTGGHRFRPCLEDFLDALINDLNLDTEPGYRAALAEGRERWRVHQTLAVIRDAPDLAIEYLRDHGYTVEIIGPHLPRNSERLRRL